MMAQYKIGDVLDFAYSDTPLMIAERLVNLWHYGSLGFTHSAIVGDIQDNHVLIYEADGQQISKRFIDFKELDDLYAQNKLAIFSPLVVPSDLKQRCESHLGEKYAWMTIFDIFLYWRTGIQDVKGANDDTWVCSEFAATMNYPENDVVKDTGIPLCLFAPQDFFSTKCYTLQSNSLQAKDNAKN